MSLEKKEAKLVERKREIDPPAGQPKEVDQDVWHREA